MLHNPKKTTNPLFIGLLLIAGALLTLGAIALMMFVSAGNSANALEKGLSASVDNNQNILASYSQKVMEAAQVPDMMRDDLTKVAREALQGRYGAEGSKAIFQLIQEQNPVVSEQLYVKLQSLVEAGRNEFQTAQTRLIDQRRVYETALGSIPQGFFMRVMGYPKMDLSKIKPVITNSVATTFETGREAAPIQLRPAQ